MAADFTVSTSEIDVGTWNLGAVSTMSLIFWIYIDAHTVTDARFFSEASGTAEANHNLMIGTVNDSGQKWRIRLNAGGVTQTFKSTVFISTGQWYHVCLEYSSDTVLLYIDGTARINASHSTGGTLNATAKQTYIGNNAGADKGTNGAIAEMALLTDDLQNWERTALMRGANIMQVHPQNIKAYWPLWSAPSGSGGIADLSGNARHGTLTTVGRRNHPGVGRMVPAPLWAPIPIVSGGGGGSTPKGPFGLPLNGAFGGPI